MAGAAGSASNSMADSGPMTRLLAEAGCTSVLYSWVRVAASAVHRGDDVLARVVRVDLDPDLVDRGFQLEDRGAGVGRDQDAARLARRAHVVGGDSPGLWQPRPRLI